MTNSFEIDDPRPIAESAKYTYFLPEPEALAAIGVGDLVQFIFRATLRSEKWDAERKWVRVEFVDGNWLEGVLESQPDDMPELQKGCTVRAPRSHAINVVFSDPTTWKRLNPTPRREYWERCLVDSAVLYEGLPVHYLWREPADMLRDGDKFPDSGWRIRGDMRGATDAEIDARKVSYVAIGAVLNRDDSWLHLVDEPEGEAFEKNFEKGLFQRLDRNA